MTDPNLTAILLKLTYLVEEIMDTIQEDPHAGDFYPDPTKKIRADLRETREYLAKLLLTSVEPAQERGQEDSTRL